MDRSNKNTTFGQKLRYLKSLEISKDMKNLFTKIWKEGWWLTDDMKETKSGYGSSLKETQAVSKLLLEIIEDYNIRTIIDAACGDLNWLSRLELDIDRYIGYDIVDGIIEDNNKKYSNEVFSFKCGDVVVEDLPKSDLIICRYCFQHWIHESVMGCIDNFKKSRSTYLLATSHLDIDKNENERWIDMRKSPFNFPEPLISIKEDKYFYVENANICLWRLEDIDTNNFEKI
jgi:hypothetical protein